MLKLIIKPGRIEAPARDPTKSNSEAENLGNTSSADYTYNGLVALPVIPINSLDIIWESNGDLHARWAIPSIPGGVNTITRFRVKATSDSQIGHIHVDVPTSLGEAIIPSYLMQMLKYRFGEEDIRCRIRLYTADNNNQTRSSWRKNIQVPSFDSDGNGIFDTIDAQDNRFSDGTTVGTVLTQGDQKLIITDATDPKAGVLLSTYGGSEPADIDVCNGSAQVSIDAGDALEVTCGNVTVKVLSGTVESTFWGSDSKAATVSLGAGNSLVFDPAGFTFIAPADNTETVTIAVDGFEILLDPGDSSKVHVKIDIKPGIEQKCFKPKAHGVIPVVIFGNANVDVTEIELESLILQGLTIKMVGKHDRYLAHTDYVDDDEFLDLVVQFKKGAEWIFPDGGFAFLTGKLLDGRSIEGKDNIGENFTHKFYRELHRGSLRH